MTRRGTGNKHGAKWIRPEKRKAIYQRDGNACVYCDATEAKLTLDHLTPRSRRGTNKESNLVTACVHCNARRGDKPWKEFAGEYRIRRIRNLVRRKLKPLLSRQ